MGHLGGKWRVIVPVEAFTLLSQPGHSALLQGTQGMLGGEPYDCNFRQNSHYGSLLELSTSHSEDLLRGGCLGTSFFPQGFGGWLGSSLEAEVSLETCSKEQASTKACATKGTNEQCSEP